MLCEEYGNLFANLSVTFHLRLNLYAIISLQVGDDIRSADGSTGEVEEITTEESSQEMYNLTVDIAHTFYVGGGQWLVHNACPYNLIPKDKPVVIVGRTMTRVLTAAADLADAGFDVHTWPAKNFGSSLGNLSRLDIEANRSWLRYWTNKGATVIDIGADPSKAFPSPFYDMELRSLYELWKYPNIIRVSGY